MARCCPKARSQPCHAAASEQPRLLLGALLFKESLTWASLGELGLDFIKRDGWIPDLRRQRGLQKEGMPWGASAGGHGVQPPLPSLGAALHFHPWWIRLSFY